ncbi:MAG: cytochrome c [Candidatus Binatus sp.]|uniref:c-type cytochrome n=1 Tax=Candidatus Binatus sp. TaxID=2811406 RepID=UPI00271CC69E|nr:cytochrome c [Candidatus Binatus sp.]MDO8432227.1 cytochrome c [Candidatus Binatus sp.]
MTRRRAMIVVVVMLALAPTFALAEPPEQLYMLNCWGCHRPHGEGIPGTAPPLRDAADFLRVKGGREYLISVPGVSQSALNNADTAAVMNWILKSFSTDRLPADFKPYTADEIAQARTHHLMDIKKARAELVGEMVEQKIRPPEK